VYVVARQEDYEALWADRHEFIRSWGEPVTLEDRPNFEGLGFDLVAFEFADGVEGEVAFAHRGNMLAMHGGPYTPLHDPEGVLSGVVFPLL
jgi:hypothetical protein